MDDEIAGHLGELYKRNHEDHADVAALKIILVALLEQIPHDKTTLSMAITRHLDALNEQMDVAGMPEHIQQVQRDRLEALSKLVLR